MSALQKRSFTLAGHRTSVALELEFWTALEAWAKARETKVSHLVVEVDGRRGDRPLASALRVELLLRAQH